MRILLGVLLFALTGSQFGVCQHKTDPAFKVDGSYFEKTWGLKVKSVKESLVDKGMSRITLLVEHEKELKGEELKHASTAFGYPFPQKNPVFEGYFFDEDNVAIQKVVLIGKEGEVTGIKGDAFRIMFNISSFHLAKTKKLAFRPVEKESVEKDKK